MKNIPAETSIKIKTQLNQKQSYKTGAGQTESIQVSRSSLKLHNDALRATIPEIEVLRRTKQSFVLLCLMKDEQMEKGIELDAAETLQGEAAHLLSVKWCPIFIT